MSRLTNRSAVLPDIKPWLPLMFLFALNFASAGGYLLLLLMVAYFIRYIKEFSLRVNEVFLFIFSTEYFLFYALWFSGATFRELCNYLVAPWMLYWIGRNMAYRTEQKDLPLQLTHVLTSGFFVYGFLCVVYSLYFSPPTIGERVMYKFWDQNYLSVTAGGLLFSMAIGVSMGQLTTKNGFWVRLFWLAALGVCIFYSFTWAHRTSFYIVVVLCAYNFITFLLARKISAVQKVLLFSASLIILLSVIVCFMLDIGGCYTWLQGQWLYQRLTDPALANSTDRLDIWRSFFDQWLLYPLGGKKFPIDATFVHNLWLDIYYECGMIPFAALVTATVMIVRNLLQYRKYQIKQNEYRSVHILTNFYIAVFLAFMVEPVMSAYPYVLLGVLLISGSIDGALMKVQSNTSASA